MLQFYNQVTMGVSGKDEPMLGHNISVLCLQREAGKVGHAVVSRVTIHSLYTSGFMSMMLPAPHGLLGRYYATLMDQGNQHMRTFYL